MANEGFGQLSTLFSLSGTALTTAYQNFVLNTKGVPENIGFYVRYTKGAETSLDFRVSVSDDGGVTYKDSAEASLLGQTSTRNFRRVLRNLGRTHTKVRVSVKSNGATDATTALVVKTRADRSPYAF